MITIREYKPKDEEPEVSEDKYNQFYELLGIKGTVNKEKLHVAFREKIKMNHPDKLAQLNRELQKIANERTIA